MMTIVVLVVLMMVVRYCGDHYCGGDGGVSDNSGDVGQLW